MFYFILGSCMGSFIPVISKEWSNHQIQWFRRSKCDHCHRPLSITQLIPILSSLIYLWKCKYCGHSFSYKYFCFEISFGLIYYAWFKIFPQQTLLHLLILTLLIIASFIDYYAYWLPDLILLLLLLISLYLTPSIFQIFFSIFIFVSLSSIYLLSSNRIGFADIKLLSILALLLPIDYYPIFIILASLFGLIYFTLMKTINPNKNYIPFIPSILISYLIISILVQLN